jgi:hypothetical protein
MATKTVSAPTVAETIGKYKHLSKTEKLIVHGFMQGLMSRPTTEPWRPNKTA